VVARVTSEVCLVAVVFVLPDAVSWPLDVADAILKRLKEKGNDAIHIWILFADIGPINPQDALYDSKHRNPNEHENCKVDAVIQRCCYKLHK
jgi:hypothetical protein